jgi:hypothetical protein
MSRARPRLRRIALLCVLAAAVTSRAVAAGSPMSVQDYIARLDRLASALAADTGTDAGVARSLDEWSGTLRVDGSTRVFEIATDSIERDLRAWRLRHDQSARLRLLSDVGLRRSEAERFERPPAASSNERAILVGVLAGREFQDLHGPTWRERLQQRLLQWLVRLIGRIVDASAIPTIGSGLVYGLVAFALIVLALVTYRFIRRRGDAELSLAPRAVIFQKDWPRWLADAQAAAAGAQWREAVHFTYWCAVAFLETKGAWRPDRARTPREYLRLLSASSADRDQFGALTRDFERIWYGADAADRQAFDESIARLRQLGCPTA